MFCAARKDLVSGLGTSPPQSVLGKDSMFLEHHHCSRRFMDAAARSSLRGVVGTKFG